MKTEKYTLSEMIDYYPEPGLDEQKLYSILKDFGIVDENKKPFQKYIKEGYLAFISSSVSIDGEYVQIYETLVVGQKGTDFIEDILDKIFYPADKVIWITAKKKKKERRRRL